MLFFICAILYYMVYWDYRREENIIGEIMTYGKPICLVTSKDRSKGIYSFYIGIFNL